jgi:hypothetical protein
VGQKGVLLRLVEAVNLVHEKHSARTIRFFALFGRLDDLAYVGDAAGDGRKVLEVRPCDARNHGGDRAFAAAGRSEEHGGREFVLLNQAAQRLAGSE